MVLLETLRRSLRPLTLVGVLSFILIIFFSTLVYFIERGVWDQNLQQWKTAVGYRCTMPVTTAPSGVALTARYVVENHGGCELDTTQGKYQVVPDSTR